jgi:hypothetical protein
MFHQSHVPVITSMCQLLLGLISVCSSYNANWHCAQYQLIPTVNAIAFLLLSSLVTMIFVIALVKFVHVPNWQFNQSQDIYFRPVNSVSLTCIQVWFWLLLRCCFHCKILEHKVKIGEFSEACFFKCNYNVSLASCCWWWAYVTCTGILIVSWHLVSIYINRLYYCILLEFY